MNFPDLEPNEPPVLILTRRARRRLLGAAITLLALLTLPYVISPLADVRPWRAGGGYVPFWNITARPGWEREEQTEREQVEDFEELAIAEDVEAPSRELPLDPEVMREGAGEAGQAPARVFPPYAGHPDDSHEVKAHIEEPDALAHYFGQLALTDLKVEGAITRAGHWGDSVLGGDGLTHALRQRMQGRFGDAGHGFHALSRYSIGYSHRGVRFQDRGGWRSCEIIFKCRPDARYGYAGVSSSASAGGVSTWQTTKEGSGSRVSRFELWYAKAPDGGRFQVKVDGDVAGVVDTRADEPSDAVEVFNVEDGPHNFEVRAIGAGASRGYGVVLERDVPGVVWDELSLIGSFTQRLDYQDAEHLGWQLRRRDIDLMVFMFGGNDVQREFDDLKTRMDPYEVEYGRVIQKFRAGRPEASCLVMSLIDHGTRVHDTIRSRSIMPRMVSAQRKVAMTEGCAFFDTWKAMGGQNSIARWYRARPQLAAPDFSHPTPAGQSVIASLLYRSLMQEYAAFRQARVGKPLPLLSARNEAEPPGADDTAVIEFH